MAYICNNCGRVVDELPVIKSYVGEYGDETVYEDMLDTHCNCGGEFEPAICCERCGEHVPEEETENGLCTKCQAEVMQSFVEMLNARFSVKEIEYIFDNWTLDKNIKEKKG